MFCDADLARQKLQKRDCETPRQEGDERGNFVYRWPSQRILLTSPSDSNAQILRMYKIQFS